jgi:hypothetical protein
MLKLASNYSQKHILPFAIQTQCHRLPQYTYYEVLLLRKTEKLQTEMDENVSVKKVCQL